MAQEGHLVALLYLEVDILEEHLAVDRSREAVHLEDLVARLALGSEDDAGVAARRRLDLLHIEFLEHLFARGGLLRLGHIGAESLDEFEQLLALLLGLLVLLLLLTQSQLRRFVPEAVVAGEELHLVVVDIEGMGAHRVEEVAVVAHHEHGVFKFREIVFEPCHGVEVEVVGRLVEQKVVGVAEKGLGKQHAHLFVTRKVAHEHVVAVLLDAEAAQQGCGVALGVPSLELGKFFLQLRGADAVGVAEVGLGVESIFL